MTEIKALPWSVSELVPTEIEAADGTQRVAIAATPELARQIVAAINSHAGLLAALQVSRGQWIHSVNAAQCLAAIAKAEGGA